MNVFDIILIIVCVLAVVGVVGTMIYRKIKGKPIGCGCGCEGCPHASGCHNNTHKADGE